METATPASGGIAAPASAPAAPTASPTVDTSAATTSATPAAQGTAPTGSTDTPERNPFIPRERFDEVNTKKAELEAQLADWKQYEWAKSVERSQLEQMASWYGRYQGDPAEFLEYAYQEAANHPVHGQSVKSRVGKLLASLRAQQPQPEAEIEPDIPVMDPSGREVTRAYGADTVRKLIQREIAKATAPYQTDLQTRQQRAQAEQHQARVQQQADREVQYVKARPGYKEHEAAIIAAFKANPNMTLRDAYDHVLETTIFPSFESKAGAKVLSDLQQKAHAATVNPASPSGTAPPKFKSYAEAAQYYATHPDEAAAMANR